MGSRALYSQKCSRHSRSHWLLKLRQQKPGVLAMLAEGLAELSAQHGFFFPGFNPIAQDHEDDCHHASPLVNRQSSADRGQIESGINGMPEMCVRPSADELVVLFESDSSAPKLSQVPPGP